MSLPSDDGFSTRAIHAGQDPDPLTGAVSVPIYQTSTYAQDVVGETRAGYDYSRAGNPTRTALEQALASLEGARHGFAFASGMAASDTMIRAVLRPGDHLIIPDDAYGGTFRLIDKIGVPWGLTYSTVPLGDLDAVRAAMRPETKLIWCETPTNPLLGIADIAGLAALAHGACGETVGGQHLCLAVPAAAIGPWGRCRAAFDHQVHRRALGRHRWGTDHRQ